MDGLPLLLERLVVVCVEGGQLGELSKQVSKFGDTSDRLVLGMRRAERTRSPGEKGRPWP